MKGDFVLGGVLWLWSMCNKPGTGCDAGSARAVGMALMGVKDDVVGCTDGSRVGVYVGKAEGELGRGDNVNVGGGVGSKEGNDHGVGCGVTVV